MADCVDTDLKRVWAAPRFVDENFLKDSIITVDCSDVIVGSAQVISSIVNIYLRAVLGWGPLRSCGRICLSEVNCAFYRTFWKKVETVTRHPPSSSFSLCLRWYQVRILIFEGVAEIMFRFHTEYMEVFAKTSE